MWEDELQLQVILPTLDDLHQLEHPTQVQLHDQDHHHQGMSFHLREDLPQDMGQSNSTRCEHIKMRKQKMATPY